MDVTEDIQLGPEDYGREQGLPHRIVEATAQPLYTNPIVALVLCRYTGEKPISGAEVDGERPLICTARTAQRHPEDDCLTYYFMLDASLSSLREVLTHMSAPVVTMVDGDLTFRGML